MSPLLRLLGWIAPRAAVARADAQLALSIIERAYDGASKGRRATGLLGSGASANSEIAPALRPLRDRSSDLVRNTAIGARVIEVICDHAIGSGITVRWATGNASLDKKLTRLWKEWSTHCDLTEQETLAGILHLALRSMLERGDALVRMHFLPGAATVTRSVPLALSVLEGDHLDESVQSGAGGRDVVMGVEFGSDGQPVGYHILKHHPGGATGRRLVQSSLISDFVPRQDVCHLFRALRPGQSRGVPVLAPVMMNARDHGDLVDALVAKARMEACHGIAIRGGDARRRATLASAQAADTLEDRSAAIGAIRPGMKILLDPGEEITAINPAGSGSFPEINIQVLMQIAAGTGITYDQLTGDLRQANYSSLRAGKIEFRRMVERLQWLVIVPKLLDRIVDRFIDAAIMNGVIKPRADGYGREYVMPAVEPIDPRKDLEADILAVRAGRMSPQDFVEAWGRPWEEVLAESAAFFKVLDETGLVLDIDPRRTARSGMAQPVPAGEPSQTEG